MIATVAICSNSLWFGRRVSTEWFNSTSSNGLFGPLNAVIEKVREAAGNVINSMVGADDFLIEHWTCYHLLRKMVNEESLYSPPSTMIDRSVC